MTAQAEAAGPPQFHDAPFVPVHDAPVHETPVHDAAIHDAAIRMSSAHLGEVSWEASDELYFPAGLPGFEHARRMVPVEIPSQRPLVYLQSAEDPHVCFVSLPVLAVSPRFELQLSDDDQALLGLEGETAMLGVDVMCLALLIPCGATVETNLRAPIVINLHNGRGVQAVASQANRDRTTGLWRLSRDGAWEAIC